jgi:hypothetical protein
MTLKNEKRHLDRKSQSGIHRPTMAIIFGVDNSITASFDGVRLLLDNSKKSFSSVTQQQQELILERDAGTE